MKPKSNLLPGIAAALGAIVTMAASGQTARPQFEVASIKPAGGGGAMMRQLPGRLTANAPVRALMQAAYDLQPAQIAGGPEWIGSEAYEIDARATGTPDRGQMFLMLQSLLEERFQLRVHRESREMPIYALVAARGGLKLAPARAESCTEGAEDLLGPLAIPGGRIPIAGPGAASSSTCGGLGLTIGPGGARIRGDQVTIAKFARVLSRVLGRTVTDRTGFSGVTDLSAEFVPDDATPGLPAPPPGANPPGSVSIFSAIQQLGLRLESARGPVEVLVIDHVERPSAN